ncbi:hypothetical protein B0H13DRAFT_2053756 [Mycena leptocephala]|nr:hypothetical protein B0H13DRAFT_2053756 [Mycena leptocephala]
MFKQLTSTAVLVLALAHGVMSAGPIQLQCGRPYDPACPPNQLCCGTEIDDMHCQLAGILCLTPPPIVPPPHSVTP